MRLHQWLGEEAGRATRMAEDFGVTLSAVSQWRTTGAPVKHLRRIVKFTKGAVTLADLLIDIEGRGAEKPQAELS
jgi:DNA-binding transcriptional regulator YdaS (Cro superfamily)